MFQKLKQRWQNRHKFTTLTFRIRVPLESVKKHRCFSLASMDRAIAEQLLGCSYEQYQTFSDYVTLSKPLPTVDPRELATDSLKSIFGCKDAELAMHPDLIDRYMVIQKLKDRSEVHRQLHILLDPIRQWCDCGDKANL